MRIASAKYLMTLVRQYLAGVSLHAPSVLVLRCPDAGPRARVLEVAAGAAGRVHGGEGLQGSVHLGRKGKERHTRRSHHGIKVIGGHIHNM